MKKLYFLSILLFGLATMAQPIAQINILTPWPVCNPGDCLPLQANATALHTTDAYTLGGNSAVFPFTGGTLLVSDADDIWSPVVNLPFDFSFYGTTYNSLLVGSNGVITFDLVNQIPEGFCPWAFSEQIPSTTFPIKNAIFGVYQDTNIASPPVTNPAIQNVNYYLMDTGVYAAPNRVFVANFNELPLYQCNNAVGLQTSQIVLHESTNIIDIFVPNRTACATWNSGSGLIGILDATGTSAVVPPGRNTSAWNAVSSGGYRFIPAGAAIPPTISWYQNGVFLTNDNPTMVCPTESTVFSATATYSGTSYTITDEVVIAPVQALVQAEDMTLCTNDMPPYVFDLTPAESVALGAENPSNYHIRYYPTLEDAENYTSNYITNPQNYSVLNGTTIYLRLESFITGCVFIQPFDLVINPIPEAPVGNATQTFAPGETLAALEVTGENIQWYDQSVDGNLLPINTPLVNNTTYYASQTLSGCSGRMSPGRLAVTVTSTLGTKQFIASDIVLYPNPASNSLTVSCPKNIQKISVYNTLGQLVLIQNENQKEIKLDISVLNSGTYFIKINSENVDRIAKFVKK